ITLSGFTAVTVTDTASNDVLNFNDPVVLPFTFVNCGTSTLNVNSGTLTFASPGTVTLGTLNITPGATVDLADNTMILNYAGGTDPIGVIAGYLQSGYNGGGWNGTGIISSTAQTPTNGLLYALGYADGKDNVVSGLSSGQIEVKYTLLGDANLDGLVNAADFTILAANFNQPVTGWDQGDFNYDGLVNAADFTDLAANFNQGISLPAAAVASEAAAAPVVASTASAATTSAAAAAPPASKSKPLKVSRANVADATNRKQKASAATTYAAGFVTIPNSGATATPQNINKDAKFLADR
ncbi:MAG: dockerin type I domain-containing protein, partial [Tepidisphaeraceae bacterium]